ncbi:hypothetical protein Tco_1254870 [Tanacetum coccineum]
MLCHHALSSQNSQDFNLAYFIAHKIENVKNRVDCPLPYGLLITRLYRFVLGEHPKLFRPHHKLQFVMYYRMMSSINRKNEKMRNESEEIKLDIPYSASSEESSNQSSPLKPNLSYLHVFVALCYPTNDYKDLGKLKPKADIGIFLIAMASEQSSSGPEPQLLTLGTLSLGLVPNPPSLTPYVPPTKKDWDILFQSMFDKYFNPPSSVASPVLAVVSTEPANSTGSPSSTIIDQDAPSTIAHLNNDPFFGVPIPEPNSKESSSRDVIPTNVQSVNQPLEHLRKWTKDYLLDHVIINPSRHVSTRQQL